MGDFLRLLLDSIQYLWPLRRIEQWERGLYSIFGHSKPTWVKGPGIWPVIPWFTDVHVRSVAVAVAKGSRQDVTLKDGTLLSFQASAKVRVSDVYKAIVEVHEHESSMIELLEGILADKIADADPDRFLPERRGRLIASMAQWVSKEAAEFGVEVLSVRFTNMVYRPKAFRLMGDLAAATSW